VPLLGHSSWHKDYQAVNRRQPGYQQVVHVSDWWYVRLSGFLTLANQELHNLAATPL
jgi:membrane protein required for beta-lactamase induction